MFWQSVAGVLSGVHQETGACPTFARYRSVLATLKFAGWPC
jgi:hypothetical protein